MINSARIIAMESMPLSKVERTKIEAIVPKNTAKSAWINVASSEVRGLRKMSQDG